MPDSRDIFRLRREGQCRAALELARELRTADPDDLWLLRAHGWSLHDALKDAQQKNNVEEMRTLLDEFECLVLPDVESERLLHGAREHWRHCVPRAGGGPALHTLLRQAREMVVRGDRAGSLDCLRSALLQFPDAPQATLALGWELQRALADEVSRQNANGNTVQKLLQEYARLQFSSRQGPLHSHILLQATKAVDVLPAFIRFFRWWNPENLRPEDFERFTPKDADRSFDSLVERVIKAIHRSAKAEKDSDTLRWATDFVAVHFRRFPQQDLFPLYYAQLLLKTGAHARGRELILPLVRRKSGEFWVWATLAASLGPEEADSRFACLCRALSCREQGEPYLVKVREDLAAMLVERHRYPEARCEIARLAAGRASKNWPLPPRVRDWMAADWYTSATVLDNNEQLYADQSPVAEHLVNARLPVVPATVLAHVQPADGRRPLTFIGFMRDSELADLNVRTDQVPALDCLPPGTPVAIQMDDSGPHPVLVSLRQREGQAWDVVPVRIGVVRQVNREKGVTAVLLGRDEFCLFYHNRFPTIAETAAGTALAVWVKRDATRGILHALAWEPSPLPPSEDFCRTFQGSLDIADERAFAFVNREIFVPASMVGEGGLRHRDAVHGVAVLERNPKRGAHGWRAIRISRLQDGLHSKEAA